MTDDRQGDISELTKLFDHNTWANLKLLNFCECLRDEQLKATAIGCFGSIRDTLVHYVSSEVDYVNLATEKVPTEPLPSDRFPRFEELKGGVNWAGDELLQLVIEARTEIIVKVMRPQEPIYEFPLASFVVLAINHSTEHRTQISTIITQLGIDPPAMSGWKYMREMGEFQEIREL